MLQIPTDKPEVVDRSLLVLEDWAHNVSFDPAEIDKERGVIMEEWRLRRGAGARMQDQQFPVLLKGSRYADRLPIGKPEILQNFKHERLKKFYTDWYRPDLMAVVAVGDFDKAAMQALIEKHFGALAARVQSAPAPELRRAEAARHAVRRGHRPGSLDDADHRLQQDGVPRSVHRRAPIASRLWSACSARC